MPKSARAKKPTRRVPSTRGNIYTLEVYLVSGPFTEEFARSNPVVARTIQIRGDQTLADIHQAIFKAFGRSQDQMYEFQIAQGPADEAARRYVLPAALGMSLDGTPAPAGTVTTTTLDALGLSTGDRFSYWFDFVADWWHQVRIKAIDRKEPHGPLPKITRRVGADPPQGPADDMSACGNPRVISGDEAADVSCLIGELHLSKGAYPQAIEAFTRAIDNKPTADAYYGRGRAYRGLAIRDESKARELS